MLSFPLKAAQKVVFDNYLRSLKMSGTIKAVSRGRGGDLIPRNVCRAREKCNKNEYKQIFDAFFKFFGNHHPRKNHLVSTPPPHPEKKILETALSTFFRYKSDYM